MSQTERAYCLYAAGLARAHGLWPAASSPILSPGLPFNCLHPLKPRIITWITTHLPTPEGWKAELAWTGREKRQRRTWEGLVRKLTEGRRKRGNKKVRVQKGTDPLILEYGWYAYGLRLYVDRPCHSAWLHLVCIDRRLSKLLHAAQRASLIMWRRFNLAPSVRRFRPTVSTCAAAELSFRACSSCGLPRLICVKRFLATFLLARAVSVS